MRNFLFLIVIFKFVSCQNKKAEDEFALSKTKDINEIIETIIYSDSLPVLKSSSDSISLCTELNKIEIKIAKYPKPGELVNIESDWENKVYIQNLLFVDIDKKRFFTKKDSLFLLSQNNILKRFEINKNLYSKLKTITFERIKLSKKFRKLKYYDISIPIFSLDNTKAYVELNYHYLRFGSGRAIYLQKIKGKWKVIQHRRTWIT